MTSLPDASNWKEGREEDISVIHNCLCPNCEGGSAKTIMLPTKVPMFREIYIMTLTCKDCYFKNTEVNFGGEICLEGQRISLRVTSPDDLNRQLIKSDSATVSIPEIQLDIPPLTQRGTITTIEGFLKRAVENLEHQQPERLRLGDVDNFHRCRDVIEKLKVMAGGSEIESDDSDCEDEDNNESQPDELSSLFKSFEIIVDDPAGNSFIENPHAPNEDSMLRKVNYSRTPRQDMALGLQPSKDAIEDGHIDDANPAHKNIVNEQHDGLNSANINSGDKNAKFVEGKRWNDTVGNLGKQEVLKFPTACSVCYSDDAETSMCVTDIPHFKEVIIMSTLCNKCGYKSNEIKGGGAIPSFGTRIHLQIKHPDDLGREVLKSDTAGIEIPEIELNLGEGGLNGLYTTVEGIMDKIYAQLKETNPFQVGDAQRKQHTSNDGGEFSEPIPKTKKFSTFLEKLNGMKEGKIPFTLIISDPLSNSFVGPVPSDAVKLSLRAEKEGHNGCYDTYVDLGMEIKEYERTYDQNEILGLNDMKTENYQEDCDKVIGEIMESDKKRNYYGTDKPEKLPDRLQNLVVRGPDHPHLVAKAPVDGDFTVMGPGSDTFAQPALSKRGE